MNSNRQLLTIFGRDLLARYLYHRPSHLTIFVTSECNYRCRMCFYWREIENRKKQLLTLTEFKKISQNFFPFTSVALTGGEPFLRPDLPEIAHLFYRYNQARSIFIPTNASLPEKISHQTEQILINCPQSLITICLSLDGVGKNHDQIRGIKGAYQNFLKTYNLLVILKKKYSNLEINISYTFSKFNQNQLWTTYREVKKTFKTANFNVAWARGETREKNAKEADINKYLRITERIDAELFSKQKNYKFGSFLSQIIFSRTALVKELVGRIVKTNQLPLPCLAGQFNLVINETGEVYPCEMISRSLGSLRKSHYDIQAILASGRAKEIIGDIRADKCACTHEFNLPDNILFSASGRRLLFNQWRHLHQPICPKTVLEFNVFDENYAAYIRTRKIRDFFKRAGWRVIYSEANYQGKDKTIISVKQKDNAIGYLGGFWQRLVMTARMSYDLLFLHQLSPLTVPLMVLAKIRGKKVAFDWDDLASGTQANAFRTWLCRLCETKPVIRLADFITVHNQFLVKLAQKAGHRQVFFLPQGVDTQLFNIKRYQTTSKKLVKDLGLEGKKVLVYAAHFNTGGGRDFNQVIKFFRQNQRREKNLVLLVLGNGPLKPRQPIKDVVFAGKIAHREVPRFLALASAGIVWMSNNPGNQAKMSLKTLEYLAMPIPVYGKLVGETKKAVGYYLNRNLNSRPEIVKKFDWSVVEGYFKKYEDCLY